MNEFIGKHNEVEKFISVNGLRPSTLEGRGGKCIVCGNTRSVDFYVDRHGKIVKLITQETGCNH